jgi:leader peptidase (prepilin peptidase)/N-methyltransferase
MWIAIIISLSVGVFAARRIIGESDSHRAFDRSIAASEAQRMSDRGGDDSEPLELHKQEIGERIDAPEFSGERWRRPECAECGNTLDTLALRCRAHRHPQRRSNAIVMIATPLLLASMALAAPSLWVWPAYAVFAAASVLLFITDVDTSLIPYRMIQPAVLVGFSLLTFGWLADRESGTILIAAGGAFAYWGAMSLLGAVGTLIFRRTSMGGGDLKLAFFIGGFAGYLGWATVVIAGIGGFLIGGILSIVLLATRVRGMKDAIPFGPFMIIAGIVAVVWGSAITDWYLG